MAERRWVKSPGDNRSYVTQYVSHEPSAGMDELADMLDAVVKRSMDLNIEIFLRDMHSGRTTPLSQRNLEYLRLVP